MSLLKVSNLGKSFGGNRAVDGVSFEVSAGELLALIGPNGAGKTTCFNLLNGQLAPDSGEILLEGRSLGGLPPRQIWRRGVGRTFQVAATFGSMTVRENIQVALLSFKRRLSSLFTTIGKLELDEADRLLRRVGMLDQAERACAVLAYGDLKRVELALALANRPKLLLMDEPTAGMAPGERSELMALAAGLARSEGEHGRHPPRDRSGGQRRGGSSQTPRRRPREQTQDPPCLSPRVAALCRFHAS